MRSAGAWGVAAVRRSDHPAVTIGGAAKHQLRNSGVSLATAVPRCAVHVSPWPSRFWPIGGGMAHPRPCHHPGKPAHWQ
jgi:hypothetical protein